MMLRVIIELKEIWCAFIERKMECRRSPAGHGRRQPGALWGGGSPLSLPMCMVAARTSRRGASAVGACWSKKAPRATG
jgi:hypothetical protein